MHSQSPTPRQTTPPTASHLWATHNARARSAHVFMCSPSCQVFWRSASKCTTHCAPQLPTHPPQQRSSCIYYVLVSHSLPMHIISWQHYMHVHGTTQQHTHSLTQGIPHLSAHMPVKVVSGVECAQNTLQYGCSFCNQHTLNRHCKRYYNTSKGKGPCNWIHALANIQAPANTLYDKARWLCQLPAWICRLMHTKGTKRGTAHVHPEDTCSTCAAADRRPNGYFAQTNEHHPTCSHPAYALGRCSDGCSCDNCHAQGTRMAASCAAPCRTAAQARHHCNLQAHKAHTQYHGPAHVAHTTHALLCVAQPAQMQRRVVCELCMACGYLLCWPCSACPAVAYSHVH